MEVFLSGIGWVTSAGFGWGKQGGECTLADLPLRSPSRKEVFPEPNQRFGRMSDYSKVGLGAVAFALRDAGLETWSTKRTIGVVVATQLGCLVTDLDYHRSVLLEGGGLASPNLFAYTLANCFLGEAAIQFGLTGSSVAINEAREGLDSLCIAIEDLAMGEADTMLAGICDLAVPEAFAGQVTLLPGALFIVLSAAPNPATESYGTVTLTDNGLLYNGLAVASLIELVQAALAGRAAPTHFDKTLQPRKP
ncbi:MAG TPA: beta-ketoacyl synthase N-terminal-like domain-containing protein [Desulfuromonadaceae bacterium]|jgi:3-oxoacyl-[acyl-carrier-protein] synthase II